MKRSRRAFWDSLSIASLLSTAPIVCSAQDVEFQVGVATIDITPTVPIRLSGYAVRKTPSEGAEQKLWAKALAFGPQQSPAILLTADNCGVCANVTEEVAARLKRKAGVDRERFAVSSSHTHTGPCLVGFAPNIFAMPIPEQQEAVIAQYTRELTDKLEQVALAALSERRAGQLDWTIGKVQFARNRRTAGGPVDHTFSLLRAMDKDGKARALVANYACHCTTLGGEFNKACGDWAGYAQEYLERDHPGATALVTIGCGADSNPFPRGGPDGGLNFAKQHGEEIATETKRLLEGRLTPLQPPLRFQTKQIELPFQKHFTREQWQERATKPGIVGYHAKKYLARLDRGESLPTHLPYLVQTWTFGNDLAMVFLPGEVVVDYALRIRNEFDAARLWINAYANDVPCYIPSRRILQEGGYEAEDSLWYYDRPARLAPETEDLIHKTVHELLPKEFLPNPKKAEFPSAKTPEESLASIKTKPGLVVELVASEPFVVDPVAIDFGGDAKIWVAEMRDFPMGIDGKWKPGGRVKFLEDLNQDGKFEKATLFLEDLPFPTGVMAWNKGVLVCAAPDILYAEDTNGDGRADRVQKLLSGFATDNYQARVNGLSLGLDNWVYGANGLIGGSIIKVGTIDPSIRRGGVFPKSGLNIRGRDFRFQPNTGEFETASGLSQQGRVRDDWGNWFGCDNSTLVWHYPMLEQYARRNPDAAPPASRLAVANEPDANQLYPLSRTLKRFNDLDHANRVTSASGIGLYRDNLLGEAFYNNAFICEPVHNLVHRLVLSHQGVTFSGRRAPDEQKSEFLASTDNWFRPVQARTGPDGALWIVDMHRFVVEHPRWITPDRLKELDLRAGDDKGRIYRVYPRGAKLRPIRDLTKLATAELTRSIDNPNGIERDRIHLELLHRQDRAAVDPLKESAATSTNSVSRIQALALLDGLNGIDDSVLLRALADPTPGVREHAIRLSERFFDRPAIRAAVLKLVNDESPWVRYQLALSLGESKDPAAGHALAELAKQSNEDTWLDAALLSSARFHAAEILRAILDESERLSTSSPVIPPLVATAMNSDHQQHLVSTIVHVTPAFGQRLRAWQLPGLASLMQALERQDRTLQSLHGSPNRKVRSAARRIASALDQVRAFAKDQTAAAHLREAAIVLLGYSSSNAKANQDLLLEILDSQTAAPLQKATLEALGRLGNADLPQRLLRHWQHHSPRLRAEILDLLLRRDEWTAELLESVSAGKVLLREISAANRQKLSRHKNADFRERASRLFSELSPLRASVLAQYESVGHLRGDAASGVGHFTQLCANCHRFRGQGNAAGPDLGALTDKSTPFLLTAILDPNAAVEDRYVSYTVETRDNQALSGIIVDETATSLVLAGANGVRQTLLRSEITQLKASNLSMMPEGLEQSLSPQALADLIAYLQSPLLSANEYRLGK